MFRKLVSNISFSPALITQVSFYAQRLRQEELTRRLTIIFTILALVVQSLALLSPPESANASSEQDLIRGGVRSLEDLLTHYDRNTDDIKDIYTAAGLTRDELAAAMPGELNSDDALFVLSRYSRLGTTEGETTLTYKRSVGGEATRYVSPLPELTKATPVVTYDAWIGQSEKLGWFAIIKPSASLATMQPLATKSAPGTAPVNYTLNAANVTQRANTDTPVRPFDKLQFTLNARNTTSKTHPASLSIYIGDLLEYTHLVDLGGGVYDPTTKTLSWPTTALEARAVQQRTFVAQVFEHIPATATGKSSPTSYDCVISLTYGTLVRLPVDCPPAKQLEGLLASLPSAGLPMNFAFASLLVAATTFYYFRTRQLKKEIRLIRHNLNTGAL